MAIFIGKDSDKAKFLKIINFVTGGGFTLAGNKLMLGSGYKPTAISSPEFRKKLISHMGSKSMTITLYFCNGFRDSGKPFPVRFMSTANAAVKYSSKAGTALNVMFKGDEFEERQLSKAIQQTLVKARGAMLIHELNAHAFPTMINDKRSTYVIMKETKRILLNSVGIPPFFKPYWSDESSFKGHGSKLNDEKGKVWGTPVY